MARAVRYLAGEAGIRQFLDVGTGLPTVDNTHEVAQRVAPECRIVYVDNDPLVLAHARALLTSSAEGVCDYIDADMRDPEAILTAAARTLDLTRPVALLLMGVMGHISDHDEAHRIVSGLLGGLPAGSYLALADSISSGPGHQEAGEEYAQTGAVAYQLRSPEQIKGFFAGPHAVEPGVVPLPEWRPDPSPFAPTRIETLGGVGQKALCFCLTAASVTPRGRSRRPGCGCRAGPRRSAGCGRTRPARRCGCRSCRRAAPSRRRCGR